MKRITYCSDRGCVPRSGNSIPAASELVARCGWSPTQPQPGARQRLWKFFIRPNFNSWLAVAYRAALRLLLPTFVAFALTANAAVEKWPSTSTNRELELTILEPTTSASNAALPVVVYLKNLAAPRIGTEGDENILRDFRAAGNLVMILDFAHATNACVPFINRDLGKLRDDFRAKKILSGRKLDGAHIFIVPEGCRLKREVLYFADTNRPLSLGIIYPSQPKSPVGALLEFSCDNVNRLGNTSLSICSDTILDAAATESFAVAMADHPVAPPYKGLDAMPDCRGCISTLSLTLSEPKDFPLARTGGTRCPTLAAAPPAK